MLKSVWNVLLLRGVLDTNGLLLYIYIRYTVMLFFILNKLKWMTDYSFNYYFIFIYLIFLKNKKKVLHVCRSFLFTQLGFRDGVHELSPVFWQCWVCTHIPLGSNCFFSLWWTWSAFKQIVFMNLFLCLKLNTGEVFTNILWITSVVA